MLSLLPSDIISLIYESLGIRDLIYLSHTSKHQHELFITLTKQLKIKCKISVAIYMNFIGFPRVNILIGAESTTPLFIGSQDTDHHLKPINIEVISRYLMLSIDEINSLPRNGSEITVGIRQTSLFGYRGSPMIVEPFIQEFMDYSPLIGTSISPYIRERPALIRVGVNNDQLPLQSDTKQCGIINYTESDDHSWWSMPRRCGYCKTILEFDFKIHISIGTQRYKYHAADMWCNMECKLNCLTGKN